jgi:hypothetical protein
LADEPTVLPWATFCRASGAHAQTDFENSPWGKPGKEYQPMRQTMRALFKS